MLTLIINNNKNIIKNERSISIINLYLSEFTKVVVVFKNGLRSTWRKNCWMKSTKSMSRGTKAFTYCEWFGWVRSTMDLIAMCLYFKINSCIRCVKLNKFGCIFIEALNI